MIINLIFFITLILIIWFDTDAFLEYCRLFKLTRFFKIKEFNKAYENNFELTYLFYIKRYHDCFFVRLITCPICLSVWLSIILCAIANSLVCIPLICVVSLIIYYLFKMVQKYADL